MSAVSRRDVRGAVALVIGTVGFGCALALRDHLDPWRATAVAAGVAIAASAWALGPRLRALFAITSRGAIVAIALGAVLVAVTHAGFQIITIVAPDLAETVRALYSSVDVGASRGALVVLTSIVVLGEELIWRGVVFELAKPAHRNVTVAAGSVGLYVLPQLAGGTPLLIVAAIGLGAVLAVQRISTGRVIDPLLTHAIWSISVFVVFPLV